jgi:steroid delta-isomerase-like uncharacterized protein
MSLVTAQRIMSEYFDAMLGGRDFGRFFTEDVVWTTPETGERVHGRDAVRDYIGTLHTQIFDAKPEVKNLVVADGAAVVEADFVGRHVREFAGIPPTGAMLRVPYCVVYDVTDDGIAALRAYLPIAAMIAQLQAATRES